MVTFSLKQMKIIFLFFSLYVLTVSDLHAQTANKVGEVYQVPFATSENRIELEVSNIGQDKIANVTVVAVEIPPWVELSSSEKALNDLGSEDEAIASFEFSVDREAPIGESSVLKFEILAEGVVVKEKEFLLAVEAPKKVALDQNFPNPFNPETTIGFDAPSNSHMSLAVYDMLGRQIDLILDGEKPAGHHKIRWNASSYASGIYFYILKTQGADGELVLLRKKMMLIK